MIIYAIHNPSSQATGFGPLRSIIWGAEWTENPWFAKMYVTHA